MGRVNTGKLLQKQSSGQKDMQNKFEDFLTERTGYEPVGVMSTLLNYFGLRKPREIPDFSQIADEWLRSPAVLEEVERQRGDSPGFLGPFLKSLFSWRDEPASFPSFRERMGLPRRG